MAQKLHLHVVTDHWSEADNSMICIPIAKSNRQDYLASAVASISTGALNRSPLEVIHNVLGHSNISTIGSVRCLSWNSRVMVDSFPPYRDLTLHASSVLCVLYSTRLGSTNSIEQLYRVLTSDRCICCDAFGPYLSLITCERCGFSSLHDPKRAPTTLYTAASAFGLSRNDIENKIPVVKALPGIYTIERTERKRMLKAVSVREARGCELVWYRHSSRRWSNDCYKRVLDTAYLEKEYLRHFEECEAAKELWELCVHEGKGLDHLHRGRHRGVGFKGCGKARPYIISSAKRPNLFE